MKPESLAELMARLDRLDKSAVADNSTRFRAELDLQWPRIYKSYAAMREALEEMQVDTQEEHVEAAIAELLARIDRDEL